MTIDLEKSIDEDARAMERIASSFEVIADTLVAWYKLEVQRFEIEHPPKHEPRDVQLTHLPDTIDKLKESQGASEETTEDWLTDVGPRERAFISSEESKGSGKSRVDKKPSRARPPQGNA